MSLIVLGVGVKRGRDVNGKRKTENGKRQTEQG